MIQISISNAIGSRGNGGVPSLAPVNTVAPVISGTSVVGYTLSSTTGTWTGTLPITYTYQWYRGASPIISATSSSYTLVNADEGQSITCQVTATNIAGSTTTPSNAILVTSLLLDLYPSSSVAYSLRKLRTAYTGSAIRVRRSVDNAEQDINFLGDGTLDTATMLDFVGYNLFLYSEDFSNAYWGKSRLNTTGTPAYVDVETAPDGTLTGDKMIEDTTGSPSSGIHGQSRINTNYLASTDYNVSVYLKQGERTKVRIDSEIEGTYKQCDLDLTNGSISNSTFTNTPIVTAEANGWYRFSVTITSLSAGGRVPLRVFMYNGANLNYLGDGTSGCYIWGFQLSQTSSVKTYQKTVATAGAAGFVARWYDQSTNGNNATQPTLLGSQGQIVLNGNLRLDPNNGKVSINLTNDYYSLTSSITTQQTFLAISVVNRAATNNVLSILGVINAVNRRIFHWASNGDITSNIAAAGLVTHATADTATGDYIISALRDSSNVVKAWKNSSALSTGTSTGNTAYDVILFANAATSVGWAQELILWNNQDLESSRSAIETAINTYYSVY